MRTASDAFSQPGDAFSQVWSHFEKFGLVGRLSSGAELLESLENVALPALRESVNAEGRRFELRPGVSAVLEHQTTYDGLGAHLLTSFSRASKKRWFARRKRRSASARPTQLVAAR